jgi:hypothetical protein
LVSILFAIIVIEIATRLAPALIPPVIGVFFKDDNYAIRGMAGDTELGTKYLPGLVDFPAPFIDEPGGQTSYPLSTQSLGHAEIGFRDDGIEEEAFAVVVGDSFASCPGVPMEACWVEVLETRSGQDFANLGVITYGPQQTRRMLTRYGLPLNPKLVLWVFFANDSYDAWHFDHFGAGEAHEGKFWENRINGWLLEHSNTFLVLTFFWYNYYYFYNLATNTDKDLPLESNLVWWETVSNPANPDTVEGRKLVELSLLEAKEQVEEQGAEFIIVMFPTREQVYHHDTLLQSQLDDMNEHFVTFFEAHEVRVIDLTPKIRERIAEEPFLYFKKQDLHLNVRGNEIVAELLQEELCRTTC